MPSGQLGECPDWFPLYRACAALGAMGVSVPPWELARLPEIWGRWALDFETATRDAPALRQQIDAAREKGQNAG